VSDKKTSKQSGSATLARVKKEMAKSRVANSARKEYLNLGSPAPETKPPKPPGRDKAKSHLEREV